MMGDWLLLSPSPKAFVPSFLKEDEQFSFGLMQQASVEDKNAKQGDFSFDNDTILSPLPEHKSSSLGGLAARIAARAGFNAPRLNTESIRSKNNRSSIDVVKSPYLTISSGISPTALLESPVFIANSHIQASPTTGKFQLYTEENGKGFSVYSTISKDNHFDNVNDSSSFAFEPHGEPPAVPFSLSAAYKMSQTMNPQALSNIRMSVRTETTSANFEPSQVLSQQSLSNLLNCEEIEDKILGSELRSLNIISGIAEHSLSLGQQQEDKGDHDQMIVVDSIAGVNAGGFVAEDGYHWRKYGQKQVKGSECPRSYYRCTHMNFPVKKKVERSPEGRITEIIYKGTHNHPEPTPNPVPPMGPGQFDNNHGHVIPENGGCDRVSLWGAAHKGLLPGTHDWRNGSFGNNSMPSMNPEIRHPLSSMQMQNVTGVESGDTVAGSSTYSNDEGQNDDGTHGSISIADDEEEDESESKRRRTESFASELGSGATRAIREPRVVVQTRSDVDILDDGYRWRKYGQKVVKGNPNPRSYYKCTHIGCMVRKHVERASNDHHRSVITTYEGKHNHDVPEARNSSRTNSSITAALASLPQNFAPPQPPHFGSFNMPMVQPPVPPHGFPMGMNQSNLAGFNSMHNKFLRMPAAHPYQIQQQPQQMNGMGFTMPRGDPNSDPNLYMSNGSSGYHQESNRLPGS